MLNVIMLSVAFCFIIMLNVKGRISTVDLLVLTSSDQLLLLKKAFFSFL
jgi:hypothetical protein